jgi:hypothetical protein
MVSCHALLTTMVTAGDDVKLTHLGVRQETWMGYVASPRLRRSALYQRI